MSSSYGCPRIAYAADILLKELSQKPFTWGRENLRDTGEARKTYIDALRSADGYDIEPLLEFVRS